MRTLGSAVLTAVLLVVGAACTDDGEGASDRTTTTSDRSGSTTTERVEPIDEHDLCSVLQGDERSTIPDARSYEGLDGSLRFLRQRSGPDLHGQALVYVAATRAGDLDALAEGPVPELGGVEVLATRTQAEVYEDLQRLFGEDVRDSVREESLPAVIAVTLSDDTARRALATLRDEPWVEEVIFRDEFMARLLGHLRLVHDQFQEELRALHEHGPTEVQGAARQLEGLASAELDTQLQPPEVIRPLEVLIEFVDDECPARRLPDPLAPDGGDPAAADPTSSLGPLRPTAEPPLRPRRV